MSYLLMPQPPPEPGTAEPSWTGVVRVMESEANRTTGESHAVWLLLAEDGKARDAFGAEKYKRRHQPDNGRDHAADAYQEHLDACCYWWAEWKKTGNTTVLGFFHRALDSAYWARRYLRERDGK